MGSMLCASLLACLLAAKPTISVEESCAAAEAIAVVERTPEAGRYRVHETLYAAGELKLRAGETIAVDLKGMTYEPETKYILFFKRGEGGAGGYVAVAQMRTENTPEKRAAVEAWVKKQTP